MFFLPIVVVASKLYVADGTSPAPTVSEVPHVRFQREFKAKGFEGTFAFDFVQKRSLASFVRGTVDAFGTEVVESVQRDIDALIPPDKWPMWSEW